MTKVLYRNLFFPSFVSVCTKHDSVQSVNHQRDWLAQHMTLFLNRTAEVIKTIVK